MLLLNNIVKPVLFDLARPKAFAGKCVLFSSVFSTSSANQLASVPTIHESNHTTSHTRTKCFYCKVFRFEWNKSSTRTRQFGRPRDHMGPGRTHKQGSPLELPENRPESTGEASHERELRRSDHTAWGQARAQESLRQF